MITKYSEYASVMGDYAINEVEFERFQWDAERLIDSMTTTVDGWSKMRRSFPSDSYDVEAIKRCIYRVIEALKNIDDARREAMSSAEYTTLPDGSKVRKSIKSISSGSESVTYTTEAITAFDKAITDNTEKNRILQSITADCLEGVTDKYGVNMLYTGTYPRGW